MAFCSKCGKNVSEDMKHCPNCGAPLSSSDNVINTATDAFKKFNETKDESANYSKEDASDNMFMAILCYLSFLVFIPIFAVKDSKFVRFHANQGLVLFVVELAVGVVIKIVDIVIGGIPVIGWLFGLIAWAISALFLVISIIGIVNAVTGKAKELPVIGGIRLLK